MRGGSRCINYLDAIFIANLQAVNLRWPKCADKFSLRRKDDDAASRVGGDENVSRFVDDRASVASAEGLCAGRFFKVVWSD